MKIKFDRAKNAEAIANALKITSEIGKSAVENAQKGAKVLTENAQKGAKVLSENAQVLSEKVKNELYQQRLKKYNPLFPEQYNDANFHIPNMIMIRDDAERRGIDVCEGAIGWLSTENGVEVLYLYDEAIEMSGIQFVPNARCDAIYYVDNFDRNRFINIDRIFSQAHEERLAELKHIAYSLGATHCTIEISESSTEQLSSKKSFSSTQDIKVLPKTTISESEKFEINLAQGDHTQRKGRITAEFQGSDTPTRPQLKWFANDDNIKRLIEMRCDNRNGNGIKSETVEIEGSSSATMSQKTAYTIDSAVNRMGVKGSSGMESNAVRESLSKLTFSVEFP